MAYVVRRQNGRFTGMYNVPGSTPRSAGTHNTHAAAMEAATDKEAYVRSGSKGPDPQALRTKRIDEYCWEWLDRHPVEPVTRANYANILRTHIIPWFGSTRVADLQRDPIRSLLRELADRGLSVSTQRRVRSVLSALLHTA